MDRIPWLKYNFASATEKIVYEEYVGLTELGMIITILEDSLLGRKNEDTPEHEWKSLSKFTQIENLIICISEQSDPLLSRRGLLPEPGPAESGPEPTHGESVVSKYLVSGDPLPESEQVNGDPVARKRKSENNLSSSSSKENHAP